MNISSIGNGSSMMMPPPRGGQRPDAAEVASDIFSKLDTKGQGYIEKSDLQSALDGASDSSGSVDELFSQLDGDSDGKVTQSEMESAFKSLSDSLDSQAMSMRMQAGGMPPQGGMPPPPPEDDAGFTKDELSSMASEVSSTDSKRSEFMSKIADNFDEADTDGDGKVSFREAMAYEQSTQTSATSESTETTSADTTASAGESQARIMKQLMQLMQSYGNQASASTTLLAEA